MREELALEPGAEVVAYCHSGSRSAIAAQVLRSLGYDARNYVGSWHEWSRHDDLPIETLAAARGEERTAEAPAELLPRGQLLVELAPRSRRACRGVESSSNQREHVLAADLRMELHAPRRAADPERLRHRARPRAPSRPAGNSNEYPFALNASKRRGSTPRTGSSARRRSARVS